MKATQYLALLRGINVGGSNIIRMTDLKACFENCECTEVQTYIQSGNVIFRSSRSGSDLTELLERELSARFRYRSRLVLLTKAQLARIAAGAPTGFGQAPDQYRYDVIFLKKPLTAAKAHKSIPLKEGVDKADPGKGVIFVSRLISRAAQSRLSRISSLPLYQDMTIRNWNTTTRLLGLMDGRNLKE